MVKVVAKEENYEEGIQKDCIIKERRRLRRKR